MTVPPSLLTRDPAADAEPPVISISTCPVVIATLGAWTCQHTSCNDIVNNQHLLSALDGIGLHLEEITSILLLVFGRLARTWQLAPLAHRYKARAQPQRQTGSKQEPARIEPDNYIGLASRAELLLNRQFQPAQQALVQLWVRKNGQNILEENAGLREILELAQRRLQRAFKTGEFGGGGGTGGGESALGGAMVVGLKRRVGLLRGRVRRRCVAFEGSVGRRSCVNGVGGVGGGVVGSGHCEGRGGGEMEEISSKSVNSSLGGVVR